jgi:hypothetical protein
MTKLTAQQRKNIAIMEEVHNLIKNNGYAAVTKIAYNWAQQGVSFLGEIDAGYPRSAKSEETPSFEDEEESE